MFGVSESEKIIRRLADVAESAATLGPLPALANRDQIAEFLLTGGGLHVAEDAGEFVGFIGFRESADVVRIESICVVEDQQRRGVGSDMLSDFRGLVPGKLCIVAWNRWRDLEAFFLLNGFGPGCCVGPAADRVTQWREHNLIGGV